MVARRWLPMVRPGLRPSWLLAASIVALLLAVLAVSRLVMAPEVAAGLPLGGRWAPTTLRLPAYSLLADPSHPGQVLAGTGSGVWRSVDGGTQWRREPGGPDGQVFVLAAAQSGHPILAATLDGSIYAADAGMPASWRPIATRLSPYGIFSLAVAPDGRSALAGTLGAIFRGEEAGSTWRWYVVANTAGAGVTSLVWAPWDPDLVLASVFRSASPVLASRDRGFSWSADGGALPANLPSQSLSAGNGRGDRVVFSTMGGGVWLRDEHGTWSEIDAGLPQRHAMPVAGDLEDGGALYAGTMAAGVYEKIGGGAWRALGRGLQGTSALVLSLLAPEGSRSALLAGTQAGLFRYLPPTTG